VLEAWSIAKSGDACSYCGAALEVGRRFFSALSEEEGRLAREDFCLACWDKFCAGPFFCYWQARRAAEPRKQRVDTGLMLEFFERLAQPESETKRALRFVLSLYLMRRKELKLQRVELRGESEVMVFALRSGGEKVEVENPGLDEEQIQRASEQLAELLNASL